MVDFTRKKFLELPLKRQHKKCAELLCELYQKLIKGDNWTSEWMAYQQLTHWMNAKQFPDLPTAKVIADAYHEHLLQAEISKREHHLLQNVRTGDREQGEEPWPIAIYLDRLRSAHNVGSIIRTVEGLALGEIYFSPTTPFITHKQVQDTSMGSYQWVRCFQGVHLSSLQRPIIALETSPDAISLYDFIFPSSFTLVVGNEEYGCSDETLALVDFIIEIPLRGRKNSLNVANAFAIAAGECARQKNALKGLKEFYDKKNTQ